MIMYFNNADLGFGVRCNEEMIDKGAFRKITRSWTDYNRKAFCLNYAVDADDKIASRLFRDEFKLTDNRNYADYRLYYGAIYEGLYEHDLTKLDFLFDTLDMIRKKENLSYTAFARMVVCMVQDIEYSYILSGECIEQKVGFKDCVPNERFGILTPIEFLYTLKGDCDTRSLLLYAIFKHFDYDVAIVISHEYAHAMLALNIPSSGSSIEFQGKKLAFWETTDRGWPSGMLPPGWSDIDKWEVALN
jgi:hypothetical protein